MSKNQTDGLASLTSIFIVELIKSDEGLQLLKKLISSAQTKTKEEVMQELQNLMQDQKYKEILTKSGERASRQINQEALSLLEKLGKNLKL